MPPGQTLETRRLWFGPDCPQETPQRLQPVRADREVDLPVDGGGHIDQPGYEVLAPAVPLGQRGERLLLVTAVVVDRRVGERLDSLDQGRPNRGFARRVVSPERQTFGLAAPAHEEPGQVVFVAVGDAFEVHE